MITDDFLKNLDKYIIREGFSRNLFSEAIGVHQTTVSSWFKRKTIPSGDVLERIANLFKIEVSELFIRDVVGDYQEETEEIISKHKKVDGKETAEMWRELKLLYERYSYLTSDDSITQEYAEIFGRVLPGIGRQVIELLKLADLKNSNEKSFFLVNLLLLELAGEKGRGTVFNGMINHPEFETEIKFRKEQLVKIACKIAGVPDPTRNDLSLADKLKFLDPIELELIEAQVDSRIEAKKLKKSIS